MANLNDSINVKQVQPWKQLDNNIRVKAELLMIKDIGDYNFESL
jgi:hypothetical protein